MSKALVIPGETLTQIVESYQKGVPVLTLSKQFGMGATTITRLLVRHGVHSVAPRQFHVLTGKVEELAEKYAEGKSLQTLADEYKVTHMVMAHFFKLNKIKTRLTTSNVNGREEEIIKSYISGATLTELSQQFRICPSKTIPKILNNAGVKRRSAEESHLILVKNKITNGTIFTRPRYGRDISTLRCVDSEEKAYFMGFFFADGYNNQRKGHVMIELQERDRPILERFRVLFSSEKLIWQEKPGYAKFILHSRQISDRLAELGCHQNKSASIIFPDWIKDDLTPHFIRGYVDGDGCLYHKGKQVQVKVIGSDAFIDRLAAIIRQSCSVNVRVRRHKRSLGMTEASVYGGQQAKRVVNYLYKDATIYLERKKKLANGVLALPVNEARKLDKCRVLAIKAQIESGKTYQAISNHFGVTTGTIVHIAGGKTWSNITGLTKDENLLRNDKPKSSKLLKGDVLQICTLIDDGLIDKEIAKRFGVSWQSIRKIRLGQSWATVTGATRKT